MAVDAATGGAAARRAHRRWWRRGALRYGITWVGIAATSFVAGVALLGPLLAPYGEDELVGLPFETRSSTFPLGTDFLGRDVLSRTLEGGGSLILFSLLAAVIGCGVGAVIGLVSGYAGGWIDTIVMRAADTFMSVPGIILALVLFAVAGSTPIVIVGVVALFHTARMARIIRGVSLEIVPLDFVAAAEARGETLVYIIRRELLPNTIPVVLVEFSLRVGYSVLAISGFAYLGFGIQPPTADWGVMTNENSIAFLDQPWGVLAPALMIALLTAGIALIGDGLTRAGGRHAGAGTAK